MEKEYEPVDTEALHSYLPLLMSNEEYVSTHTAVIEGEKPFSFPADSGLQLSFLSAESPVRAVTHDQNTDQKLMTVTEDKVLICLNRNLKRVGKKGWIQPLSLFMTLLLALATSEFDKLTWVSPNLLKATFIVTSSAMAGWLVWEIMHAGKMKAVTQVIDDIFEELKGEREDASAGARLVGDAVTPLAWLPKNWRKEG